MKYIMDEDGTIRHSDDLMEWAKSMGTRWQHQSIIRLKGSENQRSLDDGIVKVSTIFRGIDTSFAEGSPVLFETVVFGDASSWTGHEKRYTTKELALKGHDTIVAAILKSPGVGLVARLDEAST